MFHVALILGPSPFRRMKEKESIIVSKGGETYMAEKNNAVNEAQIIAAMDDFFSKAPHLPANIREVLVKIAPWIALVFGILGVLAGLGAVGVSPVVALGGVQNSAFVLVSGILTIVSSVLMLMAFPKLQRHQFGGWRLLFWSEVVSVVSSLLGITAGNPVGTLLGAVIGALIGFYILFEIKSYYK